MIAVIFELQPMPGRASEYFDHAARLSGLLPDCEGFLGVERFESLKTPGKFLSLSFFEDEDAVKRWRNSAEHRLSQSAGRDGILSDYRLRVAEVVRDYGMTDREQAPADSRARHG